MDRAAEMRGAVRQAESMAVEPIAYRHVSPDHGNVLVDSAPAALVAHGAFSAQWPHPLDSIQQLRPSPMAPKRSSVQSRIRARKQPYSELFAATSTEAGTTTPPV